MTNAIIKVGSLVTVSAIGNYDVSNVALFADPRPLDGVAVNKYTVTMERLGCPDMILTIRTVFIDDAPIISHD